MLDQGSMWFNLAAIYAWALLDDSVVRTLGVPTMA